VLSCHRGGEICPCSQRRAATAAECSCGRWWHGTEADSSNVLFSGPHMPETAYSTMMACVNDDLPVDGHVQHCGSLT
jgi:hypothetical protein